MARGHRGLGRGLGRRPSYWTTQVPHGGIDEELTAEGMGVFRTPPMKVPAGVSCEPYNSWALGIYTGLKRPRPTARRKRGSIT